MHKVVPRDALGASSELRLVTTGRRTGLPREVELWFAYDRKDRKLVLLAHNRSQWWRNVANNRSVRFRTPGDMGYRDGVARVHLRDSAKLLAAMRLFRKKYGEAAVKSWYGDGEDRVVVEIPIP